LAPVLSGGKEFMFAIAPQNKVAVFDFATRKIVKEITLANPPEYRGGANLAGYVTYSGFRVRSDGKWIAVRRNAGPSPPYEIFNRNGELIGSIEYKDCGDWRSFFLNGRDYFLGFNNDGHFISYSLDKKEFVIRFQGPKTVVTVTGQSSDGKTIASCDKDGEVCIWSTAELK
jgi:WD40 repeat protein